MTNVVLFEPHHDDSTLFCAYTMLRLRPHLVTVFGFALAQEKYGVSGETREHENVEAMKVLKPESWRTWNHSDVNPDPEQVISDMLRLNTALRPKEVWTPLWEDGGHAQHNLVSIAASAVYGNRCRFYATYRRGYGRTQTEAEVTPEPTWPALKLKAMSCYASQINLDDCRPWFAASDMLREWVA